MEDEGAREEQLKLTQDVRVYPVGRVLRDTFDADNHETLSSDVTGLMINLSRVPYEPAAPRQAGVPQPPLRHRRSGRPEPERRGIWKRLVALVTGR